MKAAFIALFALFGSTAAAAPVTPRFNPRAPENSELLPAFNYTTVESVLTGIGARWQRAGTAPNKPVLLVTFPNNRRAVLTLSACSADGDACKALSIQSYWTKIANSPPARTAEAIAAFNRRYAFAKGYVVQDGRPALQRYLTADYGFIRGNLAVNLLVFSNQAEKFAREVLRPLESGRDI